jgi:GNAT superfamily N-acetyltransferase
MDTSFRIEKLDLAGIDKTREFAAREGWNVGTHDAPGFFALDHDAFLAGKIGEATVACLFGARYGEEFGALGRYIVSPEYRGRGYGTALWNVAMAHLGDRPLCLNAALAMEGKYKRYGFVTENHGARYATTVRHTPASKKVVPAKSIPFAELAAFDRRYFPARRDAFLKEWLAMPDSHAFAIRGKHGIDAFGHIRRFATGWKIGPLFATDTDAAHTVFNALQNAIPEGEPVFIDMALDNSAAARFVAGYGMTKIFENARMYRGKTPDFDRSGIYSYASQEFG